VPGLPRLSDAFRSPIASRVPALFVSGTLDGRTPPSSAERIAKGFANGEVLVVADASHSLFREPAAMDAALAFLAQAK
jgi:pimeloyl-ACP methyl ester carboxylesterase